MKYPGTDIAASWMGQTITGKIVHRSQFGLKVEIIFPCTGWTECTSINGFHKMSPHHFLTSYGDQRAREMLIDCYRKMKLLEEKWPTILYSYNSLIELCNQFGVTSEDKRYKIIKSVIENEWAEWIFDEPETGLILSVSQEDQLLALIQKGFGCA